MFTVRNLDTKVIVSVDQLKVFIRNQFKRDISDTDFDFGYVNGASMVSIQSQVDLAEVFGEIQSGKKVILWCDGLKECSNQKRSRSAELDDDMNDENPQIYLLLRKKQLKIKMRVSKLLLKSLEKHVYTNLNSNME